MSDFEMRVSSNQFSKLSTYNLPMRSDLHLARKAWHVGTGVLGLYAYFHIIESTAFFAYSLLTLAIIGLGVDFLRLRSVKLNNLFVKIGGPFMRDSELNGMSGLPFYALGVSLCLFLFDKHLALISIMFLIFADPISSLIGILFGQHKIWKNKSLEGAVAGFCTCYIIVLSYGILHTEQLGKLLPFALLGGLVGAASEVFPTNIDDNLAIPLLSGLGLSFLNIFFQVF